MTHLNPIYHVQRLSTYLFQLPHTSHCFENHFRTLRLLRTGFPLSAALPSCSSARLNPLKVCKYAPHLQSGLWPLLGLVSSLLEEAATVAWCGCSDADRPEPGGLLIDQNVRNPSLSKPNPPNCEIETHLSDLWFRSPLLPAKLWALIMCFADFNINVVSVFVSFFGVTVTDFDTQLRLCRGHFLSFLVS